MRSFKKSLIILSVFLFSGCLSVIRNRGPYPHPIFSENHWVKTNEANDYIGDPGGTKVMWRKSFFYNHSNGLWRKSERQIFGKLVMRAYGVHDKDGKLIAHWIQLKKDGRWYTAQTDCPRRCYKFEQRMIREVTGQVIMVSLVLEDEHGKEFVRVIVRRRLDWLGQ
ncbi:MAG: hypothetical protein WED06_01560 [Candidatus Paceibacterota bacterium]